MIQPRSRTAHRALPLGLESLEDRRLLVAAVEIPQVSADPNSYASDHILVRFNDNAQPFALGNTQVGSSEGLVNNLYHIKLSPGTTVDQALTLYRRDNRVRYASADLVLSSVWTPNDSKFNEQWNLSNTGQGGGTPGADIKVTGAWGTINNARRLPIAVFDTGIDYTHPDLYLNVWINQKEIPASRLKNIVDYFNDGYISMRDLNDPRNQGVGKITDLNNNGIIDGGDLIKPMIKNVNGADTGLGGWADGISQDGTGYVDDIIGWNSNANSNDPMDGYGHGTHVSGIIAASGNNSQGVSGVLWGAQLVPVKFFDNSGRGTISQFIAGLNWAVAQGIKISNNSWNDSGYTPALYDAIKVAQSKGHLFIAAAGNNGRDTDSQPAYPADFSLPNIVSVGATDRYDKLAGFSNYGKQSVDIAAPGVDVVSTNPGKSYGPRSGTSMATPQVTAVAALIWSLRPEWTYQDVIAQLLNSADRLPSLTDKVASGRLNAAAAVRVPARGMGPAAVRFIASAGVGTSNGPPRTTSLVEGPPGNSVLMSHAAAREAAFASFARSDGNTLSASNTLTPRQSISSNEKSEQQAIPPHAADLFETLLASSVSSRRKSAARTGYSSGSTDSEDGQL